mgnify:CR=1 FL=1
MFIYLHGFNSAYDPQSEKVQILSKLGNVIGITYNTYASFEDIFKEIQSKLPDITEDTVFVGTSLGGFWSATMAKFYRCPSVIINPCYDPVNMLQKYIGYNTNYLTQDTSFFASHTVETYNGHTLSGEDKSFEFLPLVLIDMGDEVIDSWKTREVLAGYPMVHYANGNHRFDHMDDAIVEIQRYMNHCSYVENIDV